MKHLPPPPTLFLLRKTNRVPPLLREAELGRVMCRKSSPPLRGRMEYLRVSRRLRLLIFKRGDHLRRPVSPKLQQYADTMRKDPTDAEANLIGSPQAL
jgi:hypothetical protein